MPNSVAGTLGFLELIVTMKREVRKQDKYNGFILAKKGRWEREIWKQDKTQGRYGTQIVRRNDLRDGEERNETVVMLERNGVGTASAKWRSRRPLKDTMS